MTQASQDIRVEAYNGNKGKTFLRGNTAILTSTGTKNFLKGLLHRFLRHFDVQLELYW